MARLPRLVIPSLPHYVTQRGNGRAQTFFRDADYALYRDLLAASCRAAEVEIWAWVLMPRIRVRVDFLLAASYGCLPRPRRSPRTARLGRCFLPCPPRPPIHRANNAQAPSFAAR